MVACGVQGYGTALLTLEMHVFLVYKQEDKVCMKYLQNYVTAITVIKMLATEHKGEAKICSPESRRGAGLSSYMLALGTEPSPCVQPLCMLCLAWEGCCSLSPHKQRCKSPYINERGRWKLICRGRKSFEIHVSLFQLL